MKLPPALPPEALYNTFDPTGLPFTTTAELEDGLEIIGQQRAIDAIRFGIGIRHQGYNLFALGPNGSGRQTTANRFLQMRAAGDFSDGLKKHPLPYSVGCVLYSGMPQGGGAGFGAVRWLRVIAPMAVKHEPL